MSFRYPKGGFITAFYDPLQVPNAPTSVSASAGDTQATVTFTAPANVGGSAITGYVAQSVPGGFTATGSASPLTVTGLSNGTAYTINVAAINSYGPGPYGTSGSVTPVAPIGLFIGGGDGSFNRTNVIQQISISTTGNATDFGDLTAATRYQGVCSSSTRALSGGGNTASGTINTIDYVTIASAGNATDFGDLTYSRTEMSGALANSTRGLFAPGNGFNTVDYVTIASTGNATNFGGIPESGNQWYNTSGCSSSTRGLFSGAQTATSFSNNIWYVTIASTGNAIDFGDLTVARGGTAACSSSTRGVIGGGTISGGTYYNVIDYVTIASVGNATDFGDLLNQTYTFASCSSSTRGTFAGGFDPSNPTNVIQYITIASTGNATDFGDLIQASYALGGCSNSHGGTA